jgi:hypothetical protein
MLKLARLAIKWVEAEKPNWRGRLSTVDLLIKVAGFVKR